MTTLQFKNMVARVAPLAREYDMEYVAVFGSRARGDAKKTSDLDLLVRFSSPISLLRLINVERKLSQSLKYKVDLVTEGALNPLLKESILGDAKTVYEKK